LPSSRESRAVAQQHVAALVARGAARETTNSASGSSLTPCGLDLVEQLALEPHVRLPQSPRIVAGRPDLRRLPGGTCTPFVMALIGQAPETSRHITRAVSPCSCDTAFAARDSGARHGHAEGSPPMARISPPESWRQAPRGAGR